MEAFCDEAGSSIFKRKLRWSCSLLYPYGRYQTPEVSGVRLLFPAGYLSVPYLIMLIRTQSVKFFDRFSNKPVEFKGRFSVKPMENTGWFLIFSVNLVKLGTFKRPKAVILGNICVVKVGIFGNLTFLAIDWQPFDRAARVG